MKAHEIRQLTTQEIASELDNAYRELFNLRFQYTTGQLRNTARLSQVRREIARLHTILRERELEAWEAQFGAEQGVEE
ncbi:MAG TPA: 50S ribosomal protein L29 [Anaerolineae bacterium]|nr:50S ribosomal protein L29 [Anaerolineae bacterium]HIQ05230.1 50S ribosomal protein L29 [Anaerolineae bacterium]